MIERSTYPETLKRSEWKLVTIVTSREANRMTHVIEVGTAEGASIRHGDSRIRHRSRMRSVRPRRGDRRREERRPVSRSYYREREDLRRGRSRSRSRQKNLRRGRSWSRNRQASNPFSEGRYSRERRRDRTRCRERSRDQHDSRTAVSAGNFDCAMEALANNADAGPSGIFRSIVDGKSDGLRQETLN